MLDFDSLYSQASLRPVRQPKGRVRRAFVEGWRTNVSYYIRLDRVREALSQVGIEWDQVKYYKLKTAHGLSLEVPLNGTLWADFGGSPATWNDGKKLSITFFSGNKKKGKVTEGVLLHPFKAGAGRMDVLAFWERATQSDRNVLVTPEMQQERWLESLQEKVGEDMAVHKRIRRRIAGGESGSVAMLAELGPDLVGPEVDPNGEGFGEDYVICDGSEPWGNEELLYYVAALCGDQGDKSPSPTKDRAEFQTPKNSTFEDGENSIAGDMEDKDLAAIFSDLANNNAGAGGLDLLEGRFSTPEGQKDSEENGRITFPSRKNTGGNTGGTASKGEMSPWKKVQDVYAVSESKKSETAASASAMSFPEVGNLLSSIKQLSDQVRRLEENSTGTGESRALVAEYSALDKEKRLYEEGTDIRWGPRVAVLVRRVGLLQGIPQNYLQIFEPVMFSDLSVAQKTSDKYSGSGERIRAYAIPQLELKSVNMAEPLRSRWISDLIAQILSVIETSPHPTFDESCVSLWDMYTKLDKGFDPDSSEAQPAASSVYMELRREAARVPGLSKRRRMEEWISRVQADADAAKQSGMGAQTLDRRLQVEARKRCFHTFSQPVTNSVGENDGLTALQGKYRRALESLLKLSFNGPFLLVNNFRYLVRANFLGQSEVARAEFDRVTASIVTPHEGFPVRTFLSTVVSLGVTLKELERKGERIVLVSASFWKAPHPISEFVEPIIEYKSGVSAQSLLEEKITGLERELKQMRLQNKEGAKDDAKPVAFPTIGDLEAAGVFKTGSDDNSSKSTPPGSPPSESVRWQQKTYKEGRNNGYALESMIEPRGVRLQLKERATGAVIDTCSVYEEICIPCLYGMCGQPGVTTEAVPCCVLSHVRVSSWILLGFRAFLKKCGVHEEKVLEGIECVFEQKKTYFKFEKTLAAQVEKIQARVYGDETVIDDPSVLADYRGMAMPLRFIASSFKGDLGTKEGIARLKASLEPLRLISGVIAFLKLHEQELRKLTAGNGKGGEDEGPPEKQKEETKEEPGFGSGLRP